MTINVEDQKNAIKLSNTIQKRNDAIELIFEQNKILLENSIFGENLLKLKYYKLYLKYFDNRFMLEAAIAVAEIIEIYIKIMKFSGEIKTYDDYLKNCFNLNNKTQNIDLLDIIHNLSIIEFLKIYDIVDTTTKIMKENKFYTFINISNNTTCFLKNFKFENSQNTTKAILEYYKKIILLTQSKIQEELKQQKLLSEQKTQLLTIVTTRNWSYFNTSFEKITFQVACFNFHKEYGFYPLDNQKYWIFDYTNNKSLWVKGFDEINENYIEYYERINNSCEKLLIEAERIAKCWSGKSQFNSNILIVDKPTPKIKKEKQMSEFLIIFYPDNKTLTVEFYENLESYEKEDYNLASKRSFYLNPFNENKESYEQYEKRKVEMSKEVNLYASELAEKNNLKLIPKSFDKHNYLD